MKLKGSITAVLSFFAGQSLADPEFTELLKMDLGEILQVKVATGTAKQLSEAPAIVSVITADDIRKMGIRTLAEAVEQVPGLHVSASTNRLTSLFVVRGIRNDSTPNVLVMIDGVDLSELTAYPIPYSFRYPVNFIERIEIIRGPGSAVHGADAFSGVINIITKSPGKENDAQVGMNVGSFDYFETWINANLVVNDLKVAFSFTREEKGNDSDRTTPYGEIQRDGEMDNLHLNAEYGNFAWKNWYWRSRQEMGIGAGIFGNDIDLDITEVWRTQLSWEDSITDSLDSTFDLSYNRSRFDALFQLFPPGGWPVGADGNLLFPPFTLVSFPDGVIGQPQAATNKVRLNGSFIYSGNKHRVRIGFGAERAELTDVEEVKNFGPGVLDEEHIPADLIADSLVDVSGTSFVYTPNYERDLWYLSVQDEWRFAKDWELTAGIRYDRYSDFGSTVNPRLALVWNTTDQVTSKLLYGSAFRAPRVAELAFINNPTVLGNPDLDPEEIQTLELAFEYRPDLRFSSTLNLFAYRAEQLIELDQMFTYQNSGEQDGKGIEIEAYWRATEKLQIKGSLSWLDAELPEAKADKDQVPELMGFVDLRYQLTAAWLITAQSYWVSGRKRQQGDQRTEIDDYLKTDITLLWQPNDSWAARMGARNVFDEDIREPSPNSPLFALDLGFPNDFPMEGRSIFSSVSYQF